VSPRSARCLGAALLLWLAVPWPARGAADAGPADFGAAIYRRGVLPAGQALVAGREGGTGAQGREAACANCHGRSGLGAGEGRATVPPVTGRYLMRPLPEMGGDRDIPYVPGMRSYRAPYDDATLARAIREGLDSQGRPLNYLMPSYALDDAQMASLIGYLKRLDERRVPGAGDTTLDFATIVTPDADPVKRRAMLDVLTQFFADSNARQMVAPARMFSSGQAARAKSMFRVHRRWVLHVWELSGAPATWRAQLQRRLAAEPVLAVVSGLGGADWAPVHEFCEQAAVPCLFPNVEAPVDQDGDFYSLYFSGGVLLEAGLLAHALADADARPAAQRVVQILRQGDSGAAGAAALAGQLRRAGVVSTRQVIARDAPAQAVARAVRAAAGADAIVLWLRAADLAALGPPPAAPTAVYLSGLMGGLEGAPLPPGWRDLAHMAYPFDLPDKRRVRVDFALGWFAIRRIPVQAQQVQADTFLACGLLAETLNHMADAISRDYLIERLDDMIERRVVTGYYPRLTLGPGQRFASKGGYVVRFVEPGGTRVAAERDWIVP